VLVCGNAHAQKKHRAPKAFATSPSGETRSSIFLRPNREHWDTCFRCQFLSKRFIQFIHKTFRTYLCQAFPKTIPSSINSLCIHLVRFSEKLGQKRNSFSVLGDDSLQTGCAFRHNEPPRPIILFFINFSDNRCKNIVYRCQQHRCSGFLQRDCANNFTFIFRVNRELGSAINIASANKSTDPRHCTSYQSLELEYGARKPGIRKCKHRPNGQDQNCSDNDRDISQFCIDHDRSVERGQYIHN